MRTLHGTGGLPKWEWRAGFLQPHPCAGRVGVGTLSGYGTVTERPMRARVLFLCLGGRRAFAMNNYPELKMLNPSLPILVREGPEAMPTLTARFGAPATAQPCSHGRGGSSVPYSRPRAPRADMGVEKKAIVAGMDEAAIEAQLKALVRPRPARPARATAGIPREPAAVARGRRSL